MQTRQPMKTRPTTLGLTLGRLALVALFTAPAAVSVTALRQQAATAPHSAKIWVGRNAEFEAYIRGAPIDHIDEVPIGVTHPKRAFFKTGGLVESAAWKILPPGRP